MFNYDYVEDIVVIIFIYGNIFKKEILFMLG